MNQIILILIVSGLVMLGAAIHLFWRTRLTKANRTPQHEQLVIAAAVTVGVTSLGMLGGAFWLLVVVH